VTATETSPITAPHLLPQASAALGSLTSAADSAGCLPRIPTQRRHDRATAIGWSLCCGSTGSAA